MSIRVIKEQPIIELSDIVVQFRSREGTLFNPKKFTAVGGVNLSIYAGETVGLVGQSGCGKSTLANVMIGLQKPTSGTVKFNGLQMKYGSAEARKQFGRQVSVIFQDPATALNPRMKVLDILKDPMDIHNILTPSDREKRVYELLSRVGLPRSAALVEPTRLSGGQKQRVAIARGLACDPKVLLCDEATSALDPATTQSILQLLKDINKRLGLTILLITHEMEVVKRICDRVAVIDKGQLIETGTVSEIFSNPKTELAQRFIQSTFHFDLPEEYTAQLSAQPTAEKTKPIIRFEFTGRSVDAPLLSRASKEFQVDFSILMSQIDYAGGVKFGYVVAEVEGNADNINEAKFYLIDHNVKVEVLGYVG